MTPEEALLALRAVATLRTALLGLALYAFARLTVYVWRPLLDRVFVSTSVVRFVPYDASAMGSATVCVDCTHRNLPTLTHHKDSSTPKHLRGDTSTDTVFNALRAGWRPLKIANAVTCNHFDIDGLISAWALIEPLKALEHAELAAKVDGNSLKAWFRAGKALQLLNRPDEAAAAFERAQAIEPAN